MSDIKHPKETDKLYYDEEISISEAIRLWDIWEKSTEEEKKKNAYYIKSLEKKAKKSAKTYNKLSDLLKKEPLTKILKVNRKTSGWITFLGWVVLIGITFYIIMASSSFA
ncbi:MAG: hypothetical protein EVA38_06225 [Flavobacteriales bacterium]|nr:MAG: hypothetical protein EVA38_06225 [Flavobacteriales bacterium]